MTKGKPWTVEEEATLKALVETNTPLEIMAAKLNKKPEAVYVKCIRLGLTRKLPSTSSDVLQPKDLPSVEEILKKFMAAVDTASIPGLGRNEIQRLHVLSKLLRDYMETLGKYMKYSEIEAKLNDMEAKYDALLKKTGTDDASKPVSSQMEESPKSRTINQPS